MIITASNNLFHRGAATMRLFLGMLALLASFACSAQWGSFLKPFAADSLWNSRPVAPVLGDFQIPTSEYSPSVAEGPYSTAAFLAKTSDAPMTVSGLPGTTGVWDPDAEVRRTVTIPHWPADVIPATGSDGHADIIDPVAGVVHSLFKLKNIDGQWRAAQYAWAPLNGSGWGTPAHYFQGARAAAVPSTAGIMRKHEINDGDSMYRHALAMSLTFNALATNPTYVFPATSADTNAATTNSGRIPEGALLMLPASFDTARITNADLRKVAETLKVYGAYIVDRNYGTPFVIYVENGSGFSLHKGGWSTVVAGELDEIRKALRQVVSATGWVDATGHAFTPPRNLNLLSMRGAWTLREGTNPGVFDTLKQAVVFAANPSRVVQTNWSGRAVNLVSWATPQRGRSYRLTAEATGGAMLRVQIIEKATNKFVYDSGDLGNAGSVTFSWPTDDYTVVTTASSVAGVSGSVGGTLVAIGE
ncbi:MAG: hypothetical protein JWL63_609 [Rhodocyclales bacterium]|nr:hypothetical protein [Rhodocyclales bacterium]